MDANSELQEPLVVPLKRTPVLLAPTTTNSQPRKSVEGSSTLWLQSGYSGPAENYGGPCWTEPLMGH